MSTAQSRQTNWLATACAALCLGPWGCASLYQIQISDIQGTEGHLSPVEVRVSETGIDVQRAAELEGVMMASRMSRLEGHEVGGILSLFQFGPKTGNVVYSEIYADQLVREMVRQCPTGRITGLVSVRETRAYPVVSGEVVKLSGLCITPSEGVR